MWRLILIALSAMVWFWLLHVHLTLPAPLVLGLVVWAVLMTVIAVVCWRRKATPRKENPMGWKKNDNVARMKNSRDASIKAADDGDAKATAQALREFNETWDAATPAERKRVERSAGKRK